ncbi:hypothetical protein U9M48_037608 [Paspalum notatum var. saurae]|uniref:Uncharacterized protein n=1 Tax=Paspalum notatum var. saurae TaxID=547442 RepID=A0AAQ3UFE2_PASNO
MTPIPGSPRTAVQPRPRAATTLLRPKPAATSIPTLTRTAPSPCAPPRLCPAAIPTSATSAPSQAGAGAGAFNARPRDATPALARCVASALPRSRPAPPLLRPETAADQLPRSAAGAVGAVAIARSRAASPPTRFAASAPPALLPLSCCATPPHAPTPERLRFVGTDPSQPRRGATRTPLRRRVLDPRPRPHAFRSRRHLAHHFAPYPPRCRCSAPEPPLHHPAAASALQFQPGDARALADYSVFRMVLDEIPGGRTPFQNLTNVNRKGTPVDDVNERRRQKDRAKRASMSVEEKNEMNKKRRESRHLKIAQHTIGACSKDNDHQNADNNDWLHTNKCHMLQNIVDEGVSNQLSGIGGFWIAAWEKGRTGGLGATRLVRLYEDFLVSSSDDWIVPDLSPSPTFIVPVSTNPEDVDTFKRSPRCTRHKRHVPSGERQSLLARRNQQFESGIAKRVHAAPEDNESDVGEKDESTHPQTTADINNNVHAQALTLQHPMAWPDKETERSIPKRCQSSFPMAREFSMMSSLVFT